MNFPKRVPVLAKPQEGSSMRNVSSAAKTLSLVGESMPTSLSGTEDYNRCAAAVIFSPGKLIAFALRNESNVDERAQMGLNEKTLAVTKVQKHSSYEAQTPVVEHL